MVDIDRLNRKTQALCHYSMLCGFAKDTLPDYLSENEAVAC
jgi:hypothetical protein